MMNKISQFTSNLASKTTQALTLSNPSSPQLVPGTFPASRRENATPGNGSHTPVPPMSNPRKKIPLQDTLNVSESGSMTAAASKELEELQERILQVEDEKNSMQLKLQSFLDLNELMAIEKAKTSQEHSRVIHLLAQNQFLEKEIEALRGNIKVMTMKQNEKSQKQMMLELDKYAQFKSEGGKVLKQLVQDVQTLQQENQAIKTDIVIKENEINMIVNERDNLRERVHDLERSLTACQKAHVFKVKKQNDEMMFLRKQVNRLEKKNFKIPIPELSEKAKERLVSNEASEWIEQSLDTNENESFEDIDVVTQLEELLDSLSLRQRNELKESFSFLLPNNSSLSFVEADEVIQDVSSETLEKLHQTLIPRILQRYKNIQIRALVRTGVKITNDLRIIIQGNGDLMEGSQNMHLFRCYEGGDDPSHGISHNLRSLHSTKPLFISRPIKDLDPKMSDQTGMAEAGGAGALGRFRKTTKLVGDMVGGMKDKVAASLRPKFVWEDTICDGCGKTPIVGFKWKCETCLDYILCDFCYSSGTHECDYENEEYLTRLEGIILAKCSRLAVEVDLLDMLRYDVCHNDQKKFIFCLTWVADIVSGKPTRDLRARSLIIPHIRSEVRAQLVPALSVMVSDRTDIELVTEWELAPSEKIDQAKGQRENLRISVKDIPTAPPTGSNF